MRAAFVAFALLVLALAPNTARAARLRLLDRDILAPAAGTAPQLSTGALPVDLGGGSGVSAGGLLAQGCGSLLTQGLLSYVVSFSGIWLLSSMRGTNAHDAAIAMNVGYVVALTFLVPLASSGVVYGLARVDGIDASYGKIVTYSILTRVIGVGLLAYGLIGQSVAGIFFGGLVFSLGGVVGELYAANSGPEFFGSAAPVEADAGRRLADVRDAVEKPVRAAALPRTWEASVTFARF